MKQIPLRNNKKEVVAQADVDDDMFDSISSFKWHRTGRGYACARIEGKLIRMHQKIMGRQLSGFDIDHINRNKLDNRRENLRIVPHVLNTRNRGKNHKNTSGRLGVSWDSKNKKWKAAIRIGGGKTKTLGRYSDINDASAAYMIEKQKQFEGSYVE